MKTVMAAIDFSAVTDRVVLAAVGMARLLKAKLVLVNAVVPPSTVRDIFPAGALSAELLLEAKKASQVGLVALQKKWQRRVRRLEVVRLTGEPVASIVGEAVRRGASFLVIGAHGHTAIFEVLTGGVARGILARSPCPVVVVPAEAPASGRPVAKAKRA
jgi:nucleotide-binding universal stress UspA family protein